MGRIRLIGLRIHLTEMEVGVMRERCMRRKGECRSSRIMTSMMNIWHILGREV